MQDSISAVGREALGKTPRRADGIAGKKGRCLAHPKRRNRASRSTRRNFYVLATTFWHRDDNRGFCAGYPPQPANDCATIETLSEKQ